MFKEYIRFIPAPPRLSKACLLWRFAIYLQNLMELSEGLYSKITFPRTELSKFEPRVGDPAK